MILTNNIAIYINIILLLLLLSPHCDLFHSNSKGEMYRKDDIDVSNQEHTAPVYFQSLSLD